MHRSSSSETETSGSTLDRTRQSEIAKIAPPRASTKMSSPLRIFLRRQKNLRISKAPPNALDCSQSRKRVARRNCTRCQERSASREPRHRQNCHYVSHPDEECRHALALDSWRMLLLRANPPPTSERRQARCNLPAGRRTESSSGNRFRRPKAGSLVLASEQFLALSFTRALAPALAQRQLLAVPAEPSILQPCRGRRGERARARACVNARAYTCYANILRVQFRCGRRQGECAPVSLPEVLAAGVAEGCCCYCSVRHMGEHAIALRFASWRLYTARNTPKECTPATLRTPTSVRRRPSRDHPPPGPPLLRVPPPPPSPFLRIRRPIYRCAWPNPVAGEALVVFPQIRCSPRCPGGEVCEGGSHCGGDLRRGV